MTLRLKHKQKLCKTIYDRFFDIYGHVQCPLYYETAFQFLFSVMLSAQCTDERVNKTAPKLFAKYPTLKAISEAKLEDVEKIIKPIGLFKSKAKNIVESAKMLLTKYNSIIPDSIEELTMLPGVGRKTANVIFSHIFNEAGFAVDTHVNRVLNRTGIVNTSDPYKIEMQIRKLMPPQRLGNFSLLLIMHGRNTCKARIPLCIECAINSICAKKI